MKSLAKAAIKQLLVQQHLLSQKKYNLSSQPPEDDPAPVFHVILLLSVVNVVYTQGSSAPSLAPIIHAHGSTISENIQLSVQLILNIKSVPHHMAARSDISSCESVSH